MRTATAEVAVQRGPDLDVGRIRLRHSAAALIGSGNAIAAFSASSAMNACCSGCGSLSFPSPSMVVTSRSATAHSGVSQEATARRREARCRRAFIGATAEMRPGHAQGGPRSMLRQRRIGSASDVGLDAIEAESNARIAAATSRLRPVAELLDDLADFGNMSRRNWSNCSGVHRQSPRRPVQPTA